MTLLNTPSRALRKQAEDKMALETRGSINPITSAIRPVQGDKNSSYAFPSHAVAKMMDKEDKKYQKRMMICLQGIGASLKVSSAALDVIDGTWHHIMMTSEPLSGSCVKRLVLTNLRMCSNGPRLFSNTEAPNYFQLDDTMEQNVEILEDEQVLQTRTCTPLDIYQDIQGWIRAIEMELDSSLHLDVKTNAHESILDLKKIPILPGKIVMVKNPMEMEPIR